MAGTTHFFAHGKLLLTSEYTVLHGAWALAVPTQKGQHLTHHPGTAPLTWEARDCHGEIWLSGEVASAPELHWVRTSMEAALRLAGRSEWPTGHVETVLEFEREWGWGSSSTHIPDGPMDGRRSHGPQFCRLPRLRLRCGLCASLRSHPLPPPWEYVRGSPGFHGALAQPGSVLGLFGPKTR